MKKRIRIALLTIAATVAITTSVYALNSTETAKPIVLTGEVSRQQFTDDQMTAWGKQFNQTEQEMKAGFKESNDRVQLYVQLVREKRKQKELTDAQFVELLDAGYSPKEIEKAIDLAAYVDLSAIDIIHMRGTEPRETIKLEKRKDGGYTSIVTEHSAKVWDPVVKSIGLDTKDITYQLGLLPEDYDRLVERYGPFVVYEVTFIGASFNKTLAKAWEDYQADPRLGALLAAYLAEGQDNLPIDNSAAYEKTGEQIMEEVIRTAYKMTDDDVAFFHSHGIKDFNEMAEAMTLAARHELALTQIIDMHAKQTWDEIDQELGAKRE